MIPRNEEKCLSREAQRTGEDRGVEAACLEAGHTVARARTRRARDRTSWTLDSVARKTPHKTALGPVRPRPRLAILENQEWGIFNWN
jgi:hypothetical protein